MQRGIQEHKADRVIVVRVCAPYIWQIKEQEKKLTFKLAQITPWFLCSCFCWSLLNVLPPVKGQDKMSETMEEQSPPNASEAETVYGIWKTLNWSFLAF